MSRIATDRVLRAFRIGDPNSAYPIYDREGARLFPGRWNTTDSPIIYALVHANTVLPPNQHIIQLTIPASVSYEIFQTAAHPGWDGGNERICKRFGGELYRSRRSALLLVPSIPARLERNILINPRHPDAAGITHDLPEPVWGGWLYA